MHAIMCIQIEIPYRVYLQTVYLVAAIFEEADEQNGHDNDDGNEDSSVDQDKQKLYTTIVGLILIKGQVVASVRVS